MSDRLNLKGHETRDSFVGGARDGGTGRPSLPAPTFYSLNLWQPMVGCRTEAQLSKDTASCVDIAQHGRRTDVDVGEIKLVYTH